MLGVYQSPVSVFTRKHVCRMALSGHASPGVPVETCQPDGLCVPSTTAELQSGSLKWGGRGGLPHFGDAHRTCAVVLGAAPEYSDTPSGGLDGAGHTAARCQQHMALPKKPTEVGSTRSSTQGSTQDSTQGSTQGSTGGSTGGSTQGSTEGSTGDGL